MECPFCNRLVVDTDGIFSITHINFDKVMGNVSREYHHLDSTFEPDISIESIKCPNCQNTSYKAINHIPDSLGTVNIHPFSTAKKYPEYIPENLRNDYEEAHAIKRLSPKASATLARRCLQGILRDFYGAKGSNLYQEIESVKNDVSTKEFEVLNSVRQIGNIGAHLEKDVNLIIEVTENDAESLIKLLEHLFKTTYIDKHEKDLLFSQIIDSNDAKQNQRK